MAKIAVDSYLPLFGRDFLAATMGWTAAERGHYITLLITQWEQGSIPSQIDRIELVSQGVAECWATLEPKFPVCGDGLRRNRRLEEHRERAVTLKQSRADKAKRAADARWNAPSNAPSNAQALPEGMPKHRRAGEEVAAPNSGPSRNSRETATSDAPSNASSNAPSIPQAMLERCPPSPSPSSNKKEKVVPIEFPCDSGTWVPTQEMLDEWRSTFPTLDIAEQLRRARLWCVENPARRKTPRGMRRFISAWLGNATTSVRSGAVVQKAKTVKVLASL